MTRQEAIEILRDTPIAISSSREDDICSLYAMAQNMAIEALEQETVSRETYTHEYCLRKAFEMKVFELEKKITEQEPKRGKWVDRASELNADFRRHDFVCSECAHTANYFVGGSEDWWDMEKPKYCPNCGARMESDEQ